MNAWGLEEWENKVNADESLVTYQLHIILRQAQQVRVGRLSSFLFPAGYYLYTGSARRNLAARVRRHLSRQKKLRWHIDYLLMASATQVTAVGLFSETECRCNQRINGKILLAGFGASDCRARCGSHLKYLGNMAGISP
ncbi:MAG: GIY-YIG nuclease family protein [Gammaproteobacteria bacterium]|nr:GIY-YIG nuclease family protein [Gammaproteobacteria bacterium]